MVKKLFRASISALDKIPARVIIGKTWIFEWIAIFGKRKLYSDIKWTDQQKREFDAYWRQHYGKKISPRWHKLYQSINGHFDVEYLPDIIYSTRVEPRINPYLIAKTYQDKALIEVIAKAGGVKVPRTILVNSYGVFYDGDRNVISRDEAIAILQKENEAVCKPTVGGSSGHGVQVYDLRGKSKKEIQELLDLYKRDFVFQEKIKQHESFSNLHPESINTIRAITVAGKKGIGHLPLAMRIGTGSSNVDNIHAGGLVIGVDDNGSLQEKAYWLGYCDRKDSCTAHPDSKIIFKNYKLHNIPAILETAKKLHCLFPGIRMVSWDFTLSDHGEPVVIEANLLGQSIWFPQIVNEKGVSGKLLWMLERADEKN